MNGIDDDSNITIVCCHVILTIIEQQGLADSRRWGPLPVFVNKMVLGHSCAHSFMCDLRVLLASPRGLVVKTWCSHHHHLGLFPGQGTTPHICQLSHCGGCVLLWCWKLCHWYFTYQQGHPWWTGFSGASRLRQTRKKDLATHLRKILP